MPDPKLDSPKPKPPQPAPAQDRARLIKLLGRMLAEEWLARQRSPALTASKPKI